MLRFIPSLMSANPTSTENQTDPMPQNGLPSATSSGLFDARPAPSMSSPIANRPKQVSDHAPSRSSEGRRYAATATTTENATPQYVEISRPAGNISATFGKM